MDAVDASAADTASTPAAVSAKQADFDALLLEAVIKKNYEVVRAAVSFGAFAVLSWSCSQCAWVGNPCHLSLNLFTDKFAVMCWWI